MYPEKIFHSIPEEHVRKFGPYSGERGYQLDFRFKDKGKLWGVTIYDPLLIGNQKK